MTNYTDSISYFRNPNHSLRPNSKNWSHLLSTFYEPRVFPSGSVVKNLPANEGDEGSIPGLGRSSGWGNGNPLQCSCLGSPMDRGAWWATVNGVTKSWIWLSNCTCMHYVPNRLGSSQVLITHIVFTTSGVYLDLILHRWRNWLVFPLGLLCPLQRKGFISSSETLFSTVCFSYETYIVPWACNNWRILPSLPHCQLPENEATFCQRY